MCVPCCFPGYKEFQRFPKNTEFMVTVVALMSSKFPVGQSLGQQPGRMAQNFADLYTPINTAQKNTTPSKRQPDLAFLVLPTRHSPTLLISSLLHENPHHNFLVSGGLGDLVPADHAPRLRTVSSRVNALRWPPTPCPSGVLGRWPVAGISHPSRPHGTGYHPALSKHIPLPAVGVAQESVRATSQQLTPRNPAQEGAARRNRAGRRD